MDRTVKGLLALIAVALCGLLLRPFLSLSAAQAAPPPAPAMPVPAIALAPGNEPAVALVVQNGVVYSVSYTNGMRVLGSVRLK